MRKSRNSTGFMLAPIGITKIKTASIQAYNSLFVITLYSKMRKVLLLKFEPTHILHRVADNRYKFFLANNIFIFINNIFRKEKHRIFKLYVFILNIKISLFFSE